MKTQPDLPFRQRKRQRAIRGWMQICWVYLSTQWRFLRWRSRLRFYANEIESRQASMKQTLLIVRHGQSTYNVERRLPGQLAGVALNDTGRQQAERLAEALRVLPLSAIISSPLERAYNTAEYLAQGRNVEICKEPDLMDTDVGRWAGQKIEEVSKNDPAWNEYVKDPTVAPEGIETFPMVRQRVVSAIERWLARDDIGAYPTFVAHADVVKLLLAHYMGLDAARAGSLHIDNASVSLIELEKDRSPHIVAVGWTPRPGWLTLPISEKPEETTATQDAGEQKE